METYQWILLTVYLCVNCFFTGKEFEENGFTNWFFFGFLFNIPLSIILFLWYLIQLFRGKNI